MSRWTQQLPLELLALLSECLPEGQRYVLRALPEFGGCRGVAEARPLAALEWAGGCGRLCDVREVYREEGNGKPWWLEQIMVSAARGGHTEVRRRN